MYRLVIVIMGSDSMGISLGQRLRQRGIMPIDVVVEIHEGRAGPSCGLRIDAAGISDSRLLLFVCSELPAALLTGDRFLPVG